MGLPIQQAPKYRCELSEGRVVEYRPFLVKEQKYLLIAKESDDNTEILEAVKSLITAVTDGEVDSDKLSIFDLEYLFLQIRSKSVGESVKVSLLCNKSECNGSGQVDIDLTTIKVSESSGVENTIELSKTLGVTLRYPTTKQLAIVDSIEGGDRIIEMLKYGIESIYDEESVYLTDEIPDNEVVEFVENLTIDQLESMNEFFESMPSVEKKVEFKCDTCGAENTSVLRGLASFF